MDPVRRAPTGPAPARPPWPFFRSFAGWRPANFGADAIAGLTLAAIAIPEQMATARLAGFAPEVGFVALLAGAIGFAIFGDSRRMSVGADSTIAPIFAGALAALAAAGPEHYAAAAAALAVAVGIILVLGGALRLGFVADLLSIPVTIGFLAGIAGHILISQAPQVLGLNSTHGYLFEKAYALMARLGSANGWTLGIGLGLTGLMIVSERISPRFPAALIGLALAASATVALGLEGRGVRTLGVVAGATPRLSLPAISAGDFRLVAPLAVIIALVVMVQTAATTRAFPGAGDGPDVNRDFVEVGVANALAGLTGAFPVDASPPRTAIVSDRVALPGPGAPGSRWRPGGVADPSVRMNPFGAIPPWLADCEALVLPAPGEAPSVDRTPASAGNDVKQTDLRMALAADGSGELTGAERYPGPLGARVKAQLEGMDASQRRQAIESVLSRSFQGIAVDQVSFEGEDDPDAPLVIRWHGRSPQLARRADGGLVVESTPLPANVAGRYVRLAARTTPLLLQSPERSAARIEILPPAGLRVVPESPARMVTAFGAYERSDRSTDAGGGVRTERLDLERARIPPESYGEFAAFAAGVDAEEEQPIHLAP